MAVRAQGLQAAKPLISAGFAHVSGVSSVMLQLLMCGPQSCPVACCIVEQVHLFIYFYFLRISPVPLVTDQSAKLRRGSLTCLVYQNFK